MKTNTTPWLDRLVQRWGRQAGLAPAHGGLPRAASENYTTYFRQYHPSATAPEPARGWTWTEDDLRETVGESA